LPTLLSFQNKIDPDHLTDVYNSKATTGIFNNQAVPVLKNDTRVLGDNVVLPDGVNRRIEVDLTAQRLYGYENDRLVYNFLISSGTWDRTPQGTFTIWTKIRSQKMSGGSKELGTYYYLPNVPYILFFYNDKTPKKMGYSLHGTYWHNNFGTPMSHGCINMKTPEVAQIFNWATVGTQITIYGKYTASTKAKPST
jgi:lipoprotein-anchoring transpeptidase ErfK/SrfK